MENRKIEIESELPKPLFWKESDGTSREPVYTTEIDSRKFRPVSVIDSDKPSLTQEMLEGRNIDFRIVSAEGWQFGGESIDPSKAIVLVDHETTKDGLIDLN